MPDSPFGLDVPKDKDVHEVLIGGRWIRIQPGTYTKVVGTSSVVFKSEDGKLYETDRTHIQLKVANG